MTYENHIDIGLHIKYCIIIHCVQWQIMTGRGYRQPPRAAMFSAYRFQTRSDHRCIFSVLVFPHLTSAAVSSNEKKVLHAKSVKEMHFMLTAT